MPLAILIKNREAATISRQRRTRKVFIKTRSMPAEYASDAINALAVVMLVAFAAIEEIYYAVHLADAASRNQVDLDLLILLKRLGF